MAAITKDNISNEDIAMLCYYLHLYHKIMTENPDSMLQKLNFMQRKALKKHINDLKDFYKKLDDL